MNFKFLIKRSAKFFLPYGLVKTIKKIRKQKNVLHSASEIYDFYKNYYKNFNFKVLKQKNVISKNVYVYWHQGFENAPTIVKLCLKNLEKQLAFLNIIKLDKNNVFSYCRFPQYITDKFKNGSISIQHFSDLVRCYLLLNNGGFWIDSTVFISKKNLMSFFSYISKQDIFIFKEIRLSNPNEKHISNWFIYSKPNNKILSITYEMLLDYWKWHNRIENYFLFHIFFIIACDYIPNSFEKIPTYNNINVHMMLIELFNEFNERRFNYYCDISCIHKLTWKADFSRRQFYTNYDYLVETFNAK